MLPYCYKFFVFIESETLLKGIQKQLQVKNGILNLKRKATLKYKRLHLKYNLFK